MTTPRGSRGGVHRVAYDVLFGGVVSGARAMIHKALVGDEYGNVNAWANVAAAPSADAARATHGLGGATGKGWRADLSHALDRSGLLPVREKGTDTAAAAAASGGPGATVAADASGAGGPRENVCREIEYSPVFPRG